MVRRASKLREKRVHYGKPRFFSPTRRKAKIALLGEKAMKALDSAAKLAFEKNAKDWKTGKSPPDIPKTAIRQVSRGLIRVYGEIKLGYGSEKMTMVWRKMRLAENLSLHTTRPVGELRDMLKVISKIEQLAANQAQKGGIMEEYGKSIMWNLPGEEITWSDRHGRGRHMENYSVPRRELLRLVRFAAYEAAVALGGTETRLIQQIALLERKGKKSRSKVKKS